MKKISFKTLHNLVSKVDYINPESYPITFTADDRRYEIGIGEWWGEDADEEFNERMGYYMCTEDIQFLVEFFEEEDKPMMLLDIQDPDMMEYNQIGTMLKKKCKITSKSEIFLDVERSFYGYYDEDIDEYMNPGFNVENLSQVLIRDINDTFDNKDGVANSMD